MSDQRYNGSVIDYPGGATLCARMPTMRENLESRRINLTAQLASVNEALEALNSNPEFERVLDLVQKATY